MSTTDQLEAELLRLPPRDRERDAEIESGHATPLSHKEFRRRTHDAAEGIE